MRTNKKSRVASSNIGNNPLNNKVDPSISILNDDCMKHILSFFSLKTKLVLQTVCKKWKAIMPWRGIKKLVIDSRSIFVHEEVICYKMFVVKYELSTLKKILSLCGFSITKILIMNIYNTSFVTRTLKMIKKLCPRLSSLDITDLKMNHQAWDVIANLKILKEFRIVHTYFDRVDKEDKISKIFSENKNLCTVQFKECDNLTGDCLAFLSLQSIEEFLLLDCEDMLFLNVKNALMAMRNLRILSFKSVDNADELLKVLPNKLNLDNLSVVNTNHSMSRQHMNSIGDFINLRILKLSNSFILHDETLTIIGNNCRNLEEVSLSNSDLVTDVGWKNFAQLEKLKKLEIFRLPKLSRSCLLCLQVSSLESLICCDMPGLNNSSLNCLLKSAKKLKVLNVVDCKYVKLNTLVRAASAELKKRPKNEVLRLQVVIDITQELSLPKNLSPQLKLSITRDDGFQRMFRQLDNYLDLE